MAVADSPTRPAPATPSGGKPILDGQRGMAAHVAVYVFVVVPLLALLAAVPVAWGWGLGWVDIALAVVFYMISGFGITVGFHRYFTHGAFKASRPLRIALAVAGQHRHAGSGDHLGGRPPPPPRVLRQGGRPALAVAVRQRPARAGQGLLPRAHWAGCSTATRPTSSGSPRTCWPTGTSCGSTGSFPLLVAGHPAGAGRARRPADLVLVGRAHRALLGRPRTGGAAAPRHLVDQLDLPHDRRPALRGPRPVAQRLAAGRPVASASPGTTCTTPTRPAPATACSAARSTSPPGSSGLFEKFGWASAVRWPTPRRLEKLAARA